MLRNSTEGGLDEQQLQQLQQKQEQLERRRRLNREAQKRFRERKQQAKRQERGEELASPSSGSPGTHDQAQLNFSLLSLAQPWENGGPAAATTQCETSPSESPSSEHMQSIDPTTAASPTSNHSTNTWGEQSLLTACSFASPFSPAVGQAGLGACHLLTTPLETILSANDTLQWHRNSTDRSVASEQSFSPLGDESLSTTTHTPPATTPSAAMNSYSSNTTANTPFHPEDNNFGQTQSGDEGTVSLNTALFLAAEHGHAGVVRTLVQSGADVNATDENGNTALHLAVRFKHQDVMSVLLRHGARRHVQNFDGLEPLQLAAKVGFDLGVKLLLRGN